MFQSEKKIAQSYTNWLYFISQNKQKPESQHERTFHISSFLFRQRAVFFLTFSSSVS
jgi:hypothetical protein